MHVQPAERERHGRSASAPAAARATPVSERDFVGRDLEMAELARVLDAVLAGSGRCVLISGDAGIGKTRLAAEFSSAARTHGAAVLWGRCWEAGGAPAFWPWIDALRQAVASEHLPRELALGHHGAYVAELVPELRARLVGAGTEPPRPSDPESARFLMFDAVAGLLRVLAASVPVVVVLDDLHVADQASLLLLAFAARTLHDARILLVGTFRDPDAFRSPERAQVLADLGRQTKRLALHGLGLHDVGHLIARAAGRVPSDSFVSRIHRVTDGNPFFVDELVQLLAAEGRLDAGVEPDGAFRIPHGVREAVRRRLEQLPRDSIALLEVAAVIGRDFDLALLRFASGVEHLGLLEALEEPVRLGLVVEAPSGAPRFHFRHALIREVLYEDLAPASRLRLHRMLAESLEALATSDPERYADELAHHFLLAAPAGGDDRFLHHGMRAARRALARMAFEEAVDLHQRVLDALSFVPADQRTRCEVLLALGEAKEWANDVAGSRDAFERAAAIARSLGARDLLVDAALGVGAVQALKFTATSRCESAPALLHEALASIDEEDTVSRARLLSRLALHHLSIGERSVALRISSEAVASARAGEDSDALGRALIARQAVLFGPDHLDERATLAAELLDLARASHNRDFELRGRACSFTVKFERGDIPGADRELEAHARLAEEVADPFERWANLVWHGERVLLEGRFDEAESYARRAFELSRTTPGPHTAELYGPTSFAGQMILLDETRDDAPPDDETVEHYRSRYPELSAWQVARLSGLTRSGQVDAVRQELRSLPIEALREFERNGAWLVTMSYLSEAVELVGDVDRARVIFELLSPFARRNGTISHVASRGAIAHYLALLSATLGRWADAETYFEVSLEMNRRMRAEPHVARTLYEHGRLLGQRAAGSDPDRSARLIEEALAIATRLGMSGLAAKCAALRTDTTPPLDARATDTVTTIPRLVEVPPLWTIELGERRAHLKGCKGLIYLRALLSQPDREIPTTELLALASAGSIAEGLPSSDSHANAAARSGVAIPLIDVRARRAYEQRIDSLVTDLARAERAGEPEECLGIREELRLVQRELARAVGLGGRTRHSSDAERARVSVTRAIRLAIRQIALADVVIGEHMSRHVRTGTRCCYEPVVDASGERRGL